MTPGETSEIIVPVRLDRLSRLLEAGVVESRIRWDGGSQASNLVVSGEVDETSTDIVPDGWDVLSVGDEEQRSESESLLPNAAGWTLEGEWTVPESLGGRTLTLVTTGSPADYRVNGSGSGGETVSLCAPCSRGTRLAIAATTTGSWQRMPVIRVSDPPGQ
jgi:hypothetical protein